MSSSSFRAPLGALFWISFLLAGVASLAPVWIPEYLPATDLPQHAAQIALWQALDAGDPAVEGRYTVHWLNPYLVGYGLTCLFALLVSIPIAIKLVISVYVLGLPLATLDLLRRRDADPWWSLAAFPLAFGVSFYWGFLNFFVGIPVAILYLGRLESLLRRPIRLFLATVALLPFHVLLFGWCAGAGLAGAAFGRPDPWRARLRRAGPLLAALPCLALWLGAMHRAGGVLEHGVRWDWGSQRVLELFSYLLSAEGNDLLPAFVVGVFLVGLLTIARIRPVSRLDVVVGSVVLAGALLLPREAFGLDWISPRFAIFPALWFLSFLGSPETAWKRRAARAWALVFAVAWPLWLLPSFLTFDREMEDFNALTARIRPGERVLGVITDATSDAVSGHPFGHATAWLRLKGSEPVFEFALLPQSFVQRTDRALDPLPPGAWHDNPRVAIRSENPDVLILRRPERGLVTWVGAQGWRHSTRIGDWWLVRRERRLGEITDSRG